MLYCNLANAIVLTTFLQRSGFNWLACYGKQNCSNSHKVSLQPFVRPLTIQARHRKFSCLIKRIELFHSMELAPAFTDLHKNLEK